MAFQEDHELMNLIPPNIYNIFKNSFGFNSFTEVQRSAIVNLLSYKDVIVQAPTGSGKTLAYVIPMYALLQKAKKRWSDDEIGALILAPSRELVLQVSEVCRPFADALGITLATAIGGKKGKKIAGQTAIAKATVIVATPGRFQKLAETEDVKKALKSLEFLVVDEADKLVEVGLREKLSEFLSGIPKQRRTGLFSATQAKEVGDLASFGLRNPITISIFDSESSQSNSSGEVVTPASLQNYYAMVNADEKLSALVEFIRNQKSAKILVFFSTCRCVEYMKTILTPVLSKRKLIALHGKNKNSEKKLELFRKTGKTVLFSTDVMSRGIDIPNIDWVVQFDIPKLSSWFVHRAGRSARCGREGKSLLLISKEQEAYIQFLQKYEKVTLKHLKIPTSTALKAENLRKQIIKQATYDRDILEKGTRAYVSFIESYSRHDCNIVCPLNELDIVGCAHAYGLLRIPRMKEFKKRDLSGFKRVDVATSTIPYRKKAKEFRRQEKLLKRNQEKESLEEEEKDTVVKQKTAVTTRKRKHREEKTKKGSDELADDIALLKKFKGGRLSKKELAQKFVSKF